MQVVSERLLEIWRSQRSPIRRSSQSAGACVGGSSAVRCERHVGDNDRASVIVRGNVSSGQGSESGGGSSARSPASLAQQNPQSGRDRKKGRFASPGCQTWLSSISQSGKSIGGQGQNRTVDTRIFSPLLYRLSYLPTPKFLQNFADFFGERFPEIRPNSNWCQFRYHLSIRSPRSAIHPARGARTVRTCGRNDAPIDSTVYSGPPPQNEPRSERVPEVVPPEIRYSRSLERRLKDAVVEVVFIEREYKFRGCRISDSRGDGIQGTNRPLPDFDWDSIEHVNATARFVGVRCESKDDSSAVVPGDRVHQPPFFFRCQ